MSKALNHIRNLLGVCTGSLLIVGLCADPVHAQESVFENDGAIVRKILLADDSVVPKVTLRWISRDGPRSYSEFLPYGPPMGGEVLRNDLNQDEDADIDARSNIRAYVALGGSRVDTGAGHPRGLVIRTGLTKVENTKAFFDRIKPGTGVEIQIDGVVLSEPVKYHDGTGIMHLKYSLGDLEACSLPGTARNQYLLSDPTDTLGGRVVAGVNATPGALNGEERVIDQFGSMQGSFSVKIDEQDPTRVSFVTRVPYGLLRHLQDPWESTLPGTFFEPIHLHAEIEVLPVWAEPFDREWTQESNDPVDQSEIQGSGAETESGIFDPDDQSVVTSSDD
ncbi:MAG: hypothetical protein AB8C13_08390 [Phycisphaerales bacterium]